MTTAERVAACRARRRAASKCIDCGKAPARDRTRCRGCLRDRAESSAKYRQTLVNGVSELSDEVT